MAVTGRPSFKPRRVAARLLTTAWSSPIAVPISTLQSKAPSSNCSTRP